MSLRYKVPLLILMVTLISMGAVGWLGYRVAASSIESDFTDDVELTAERTLLVVEQYVESLTFDLNLFASDHFVVQLLEQTPQIYSRDVVRGSYTSLSDEVPTAGEIEAYSRMHDVLEQTATKYVERDRKSVV